MRADHGGHNDILSITVKNIYSIEKFCSCYSGMRDGAFFPLSNWEDVVKERNKKKKSKFTNGLFKNKYIKYEYAIKISILKCTHCS